MIARVMRLYCERLEEVIESIAAECEAMMDACDELSVYQTDKLTALRLLEYDLNNIKRVEESFKN